MARCTVEHKPLNPAAAEKRRARHRELLALVDAQARELAADGWSPEEIGEGLIEAGTTVLSAAVDGARAARFLAVRSGQAEPLYARGPLWRAADSAFTPKGDGG